MDLALMSKLLWRFRLDELSSYYVLLLYRYRCVRRATFLHCPRYENGSKLSSDLLVHCSGHWSEHLFGHSLFLALRSTTTRPLFVPVTAGPWLDAFPAPKLAKLPRHLWLNTYIGDFGDLCVHLLCRHTVERTCAIQLSLATPSRSVATGRAPARPG